MKQKAMLVMLMAAGALLAAPTVAAESDANADAAGCRPESYPDGSVIVRCSGTSMSGCAWVTTYSGSTYAVCFVD